MPPFCVERDVVFPLVVTFCSGRKPNRRPNPGGEESAGPILQLSPGLSLPTSLFSAAQAGIGAGIEQTIAAILQNVSVDVGRVTISDHLRLRQPGFQAEKTIEIRVLALYYTYRGQFEIEETV